MTANPGHGRAPKRPGGDIGRAVVLAGGRGTRLLPYTAVIPKPLMPVGDRPILEIVLAQLRRADFKRVTISTGYRANLIEAVFGDGSEIGISIDYLREVEPLGTAGSLALIEDLDEPFLVMNADVLTDLDYRELMARHLSHDACLTIATTLKRVQINLGVMRFTTPGEGCRLTEYVEKPSLELEASMGVYVLSPSVLGYIEPGLPLDFPELVMRLLEAGEPVDGWRPDAYWLDIGRHEDYEEALNEFERMRDRLLPPDKPSMLRS
jgi:NDP-sugar pyrophosphorylase family protein